MSALASAQKLPAAKCLLIAGSLSWGCGEILGLEKPHPRPTKQSGGASGQATGGVSGTEAGEGGTAGTEQGTAGDPGGAGTGGSSDGCTVGARRCGGEMATTPEVCDDKRNWVVNDSENEGADCPVLCEGGACRECVDGPPTCRGKEPQYCVDGAWQVETPCPHYCRNGACESPLSCGGGIGGCGSKGGSCCSASEVPGGWFFRDYDDVDFTNRNYCANLSPFLLDEFEVTVGRFRNFVEAYASVHLYPEDGKADHITYDNGWRATYRLPATAQELRAQLACTGSTWTDDRGSNDARPVNCVDFFVAYAFCIWDGGRLPTEAEWNRAAAGGNQQRRYPWSMPAGDPLVTPEHAAYGDSDLLPPAVGWKPIGNGLWSHADLAGSLFEWTLDPYINPYELGRCNDCLPVRGMTDDGFTMRSIRGGSFTHGQEWLRVSNRESQREDTHQYYMGFRCVRDIDTQPLTEGSDTCR